MDFNGFNDVAEQSFGYYEPDMMEKKKNKNHSKNKNKKEKNKEKGKGETSHAKQKRTQVINFFKQDGVNNAPYAYELWPDKDEANARSLFAKCLYGKLNDNGNSYSFDDSEINTLFSLMSSSFPTKVRSGVNEGFKLNDGELRYVISEVRRMINENAINEEFSYLNESWEDDLDAELNSDEEEETFDYGSESIDEAKVNEIVTSHGWHIIKTEPDADCVRYFVTNDGEGGTIQEIMKDLWGFVANPDMVNIKFAHSQSMPNVKCPVIVISNPTE